MEQGLSVEELEVDLDAPLPPEPTNIEDEYDEEFNFSDR